MKVTPVSGKHTGKELPAKDNQLMHTRNKWKKRLPRRKCKQAKTIGRDGELLKRLRRETDEGR